MTGNELHVKLGRTFSCASARFRGIFPMASHLLRIGEGPGLGLADLSRRKRKSWWAWCALAVLAAVTAPAFGQCQYDVTIIAAPICPEGGFPVQAATWPTDMSENGVVVGYYEQCDEIGLWEAFMWSEQSGFVTLPRPAGVRSAKALAVSDDGSLIVGQMIVNDPDQPYVAFIYKNGEMVNLHAQAGHQHSSANGVANSGLVVGVSTNVLVGPQIAVRWVNQILDPLQSPDKQHSGALDINNSETVTGYVGPLGFNSLAAIWTAGQFEALKSSPGAVSAAAQDINNCGSLAGYQGIPDEQGAASKPTVWRDGIPTVLPTFPGVRIGLVYQISDFSTAVGRMKGSGYDAPLWINDQVYDLKDLIDDPRVLEVLRSVAIDRLGRIVAPAQIPVTDVNGIVTILLTPIGSGPTDLNKDCVTDINDLSLLLSEWNRGDSFADIDHSGNVDVRDLFRLLAGWG